MAVLKGTGNLCLTTGSTTSGTFSIGNHDYGDVLTIRDSYNGCAWVGDVSPDTQLHIYTEKENNMRGLFIVYLVDYKASQVLHISEAVVADNVEKAKLKALKEWNGDVDLDDLDIIVLRLGDVRAKKEVQEVRIAK